MHHELVLQFRGGSLPKLIALGDLEVRIRGVLSPEETFEGVSETQDLFNIFIHTDNPAYTFQKLRSLFEHAERSLGFTAAYRVAGTERFRILWPDAEAPQFLLEDPPA